MPDAGRPEVTVAATPIDATVDEPPRLPKGFEPDGE
jgi:hypothetical protein